jgi:hypothetical protein
MGSLSCDDRQGQKRESKNNCKFHLRIKSDPFSFKALSSESYIFFKNRFEASFTQAPVHACESSRTVGTPG